MRKVFLDDLPKKEGFGANKGRECTDWKNSVGYMVNFIYDDIEGYVKIIDTNSKNETIDIIYDNNIYSFKRSVFLKCGFGIILGKILKSYKFQIGDIITNSSNIKILKQIRFNKSRGYLYECLNCGNIFKISESNLNQGKGCNVCCNPPKKVLKGYNDLWTKYPEVAKLLKYPDYGYKLTYQSNKIEIFICPDCGYEKNYKISDIVNGHFICPRCNDGISFPNKFIREFICQIREEYIPEYSPKWANNKRYDNYLPNRNEIWEVHGMQHYEKTGYSLDKNIEVDKIKKELAEQNGYKYIEIDARKSELKWIKSSLENLPEMQRYDLLKINWIKCYEFGCSNFVKQVSNLWNSGINNTNDISIITKLHYTTVHRYLKQADELGWCNYNSRKNIIQLNDNNEYIKEWSGISIAGRELNINRSNIRSCCRGERNIAGGFKWMYKEDYERYINQNKNYEDCLNQSFSFV